MNKQIRAHYDDLPKEYTEQYSRKRFARRSGYVANYIRMQHILTLLSGYRVKKVLDAGCGEGSPLLLLHKAGYHAQGFDFSPRMVHQAKINLAKNNLPKRLVIEADINDILSYADLGAGKFDATLSLGVFPHLTDESLALCNLKSKTRKGGLIIVEFRNRLFDLFALNAPSRDFYLKELYFGIEKLPVSQRNQIAKDITKRFAMEYPKQRMRNPGSNAPGYDAILSKFHNPFEIERLFSSASIDFVKNIFYHYHPYPPYYENINPRAFAELSVELEHEQSGWKGLFMASAFLSVGIVR